MKIITDVVRVWKSLTKSEQRELNSEAMSPSDAGWRMRCKIIRNLVRGESTTVISRGVAQIAGLAEANLWVVQAFEPV